MIERPGLAGFHRDELLPIRDFLKQLPGLTSTASNDLLNALFDAIAEGRETLPFGAFTVPTATVNGWFLANSKGQQCVDPNSARPLLELCRAGALPMTDGPPGEVPRDLLEYAEGRGRLLDEARSAGEATDTQATDWRRKVANHACVAEAEFSYSLLNKIFFNHHGPAGGSIEIGGIQVYKFVLSRRSSSGNRFEADVIFRWQSADGTIKELQKESLHAGSVSSDRGRK